MSRESRNINGPKKSALINVIGTSLFLLIAVIIPIIALAVELGSSLSASSFVDPIPTIYHVLLVASVPGINLAVWLRLRRIEQKGDRFLLTLLFFSMAISLIYTIAYLPLLPISFVLIIYLGLGLLPLAPLLSLIGSMILFSKFKAVLKNAEECDSEKPVIHKKRYKLIGFTSAIAVMAMLEVPGMLTNYGLNLYKSENHKTKQQGLEFLRRWGDESVMLSNCYTRSLRLFDLGGYLFARNNSGRSIGMARAAYYQVTGKSFNELSAPETRGRNQFGFNLIPGSRFQVDDDQGDQQVGGRLNKLWLHSSSLDGVVDTRSGIAYIEWTFEYKNTSNVVAEVRKEIQLPPNSVISRVTLWVNGKEREAVITSRNKATRVYRSIVKMKRDPILVTLSGKDRALVQMYPVPANGGIMKARIGITIPLSLQNADLAVMDFPKITTRNFNIDQNLKHSIWFETKQDNGLRFSQTILKKNTQTGDQWSNKIVKLIEHSRFQKGSQFIVTKRKYISNQSYSDIPRHLVKPLGISGRVRQIISDDNTVYKKIIIVLDGGISMLNNKQSIVNAVKHLPDNIRIEFIVSGDQAVILHPMGLMSASDRLQLVQNLENYVFRGGTNNILALQKSLEASINKTNSDERTAIIWIYGPQPYLLSSMNRINQLAKRSNQKTTLYYVPTELSHNKIIAAMPKSISTQYMLNYWGLDKGLVNLLNRISGKEKTYSRRYQLEKIAKNVTGKPKTSLHILRLWAKAEVDRLLVRNVVKNRVRAQTLSKHMRLVTEVSGAIVLETDNEYKRFQISKNKLKPGMVPAVPEPGTWLLLFLTGLAFIFMVSLQNRRLRLR